MAANPIKWSKFEQMSVIELLVADWFQIIEFSINTV